MEPNQSNKNNVPPAGDQNVERLLKSAYAPQDPSDAFVRRAQAAMLAAARKRAGRYDSHSTAGGAAKVHRLVVRPQGVGCVRGGCNHRRRGPHRSRSQGA